MVFSEDEKLYVFDLHSYADGSIKSAAEMFNLTFQEITDIEYQDKKGLTISYVSVSNLWGKYGLTANGHGGLRSGLSDDQLRELHEAHGGDLTRMLVHYKFSADHLKNRCNSLELKIHNIPKKMGKVCDRMLSYRYVRTGRSRNNVPRNS